MPAGLGTSYSSLSEDVYKSTTTSAAPDKFNVLDSMKKAFQQNFKGGSSILNSIGGGPGARARHSNSLDTVSLHADEPTPIIIGSTMPSDSMDDIELKNIQLQFPTARTLSRDDTNTTEEQVMTEKGSILVAIQGDRRKPAIMSFHDIGLNYIANFQAFFNYIDMRALLENFCVYHVNAPGQEEGAPALPEDYIYPTMDELADMLNIVMAHYNLKSVIGFGVGAGANILARFALNYPNKVECMCLINCASTQAGWIEWGYQKMNLRNLRAKGMTEGVRDYLMWHHFGKGTDERNHDLVEVYKQYFERHVQPVNLALFIDSYIRRSDLSISRETDPGKKNENTLRMSVMNITGAFSPHIDDTVTLNGRLDPTNSTWMKIQDCGMVLEEQPGKVCEAFRLFLQGQGYAVALGRKLSSASVEGLYTIGKGKMAKTCRQATTSVSLDGIDSAVANIHITENPISEAAVC
ncbi:protein NDRG3 isoform X3 [Cloeon dipterum]|uniref:protein NDRG3 isoform X3 n=1 Tax=Cloeon dipterum TaxID=197152 RepID=UPI0032209516